jgi:hypothetical protein
MPAKRSRRKNSFGHLDSKGRSAPSGANDEAAWYHRKIVSREKCPDSFIDADSLSYVRSKRYPGQFCIRDCAQWSPVRALRDGRCQRIGPKVRKPSSSGGKRKKANASAGVVKRKASGGAGKRRASGGSARRNPWVIFTKMVYDRIDPQFKEQFNGHGLWKQVLEQSKSNYHRLRDEANAEGYDVAEYVAKHGPGLARETERFVMSAMSRTIPTSKRFAK